MRCPKCKSENTQIQLVSDTKYKKGHGCLFTFLFGFYYWGWLIIKWIIKFSVAVMYEIIKWGIIVPVTAIKCMLTKEKFILANIKKPKWLRQFLRRRGKVYNERTKHMVCQDCSYHWGNRLTKNK